MVAFVLGLFIFYKNPQSKINLSFFVFTMLVVLLDFVSYNFRFAPTYEWANFWVYGYATYHWSVWGQFVFTLALTEQWDKLKDKKIKLYVHGATVLITVLYLLGFYFSPSIVREEGYWNLTYSQAFLPMFADIVMSIWGLGIYIAVFVLSIRFYKRTFDPMKKIQIKYFLWAIVIGMAADLFQSMEWFGLGGFSLSIFASMSIFSAIVAIAIVKYDFMAINASTAAESITSTMSDAVFLLSPDYKVRLVNVAALRMLGLVRERILGRPVTEFIKSQSPLDKLIARLLSKKQVSDVEAVVSHDITKEKTPVSLSAAYIKDSSGNVTRGIVCIVRDIKERKLQEERLQSSYESIRLADEQIRAEVAKLQATLSAIGEGLVLVGPSGAIMMSNPSAQALLGWKEQEVIGKSFDEYFRVTTEKGSVFPIAEKLHAVIKKKTSLRYSLSDSLYVAARSKRIPISTTISPVRFGDEVLGAIVIFENITREMEIDKAKSEFVSLAAHQLRTPITAIMWNLEIAEPELKGKVSNDIYDSVLTSYQQAGNMSNLVNQFLNVSRIDLGKFSVNPEPLDLASTLKEVISEQEMVAKKKKQVFTVKVDKGIPIIPLDKVLIRIVLQNLISNAIKYTPEEGKVTITLKKQNQNALFTVKDSGIGIPEAQQKNLFNKLFRAQNAVSSGQEGNGLGLYIVKSIVQLMKGTIAFTSAENKGTTFTVEIPYKGMEKKEGTRELMEVPS